MRADQPRVVVTGLGATTPLGGDVASTWESLLAGRSGAVRLPDDWTDVPLPVQIAAPAAVDPTTQLERVQARRLDRCEQFAIVAAREAWADAGSPDVDPDRLGIVLASGIGGVASTIAAYDTLNEKGWQRLSPFTVPMLMPNGSAGWLAIELGAHAEVHTPVSACASGAEAIGYAMDMIRSGRADVVLAGGTEAAIIPLNVAAFAAMRALSTRNDEPERASRPFDRGRDGFLLGEGPACWCWNRPSTPPGAARPCTRSRPGWATPRTRTTSRSPSREAPGWSRRCSGRWPTRAWTPSSSCTSTRTPRPPQRATWWRARPSPGRSAAPPPGSWCRPPSR